MPGARGGAPQIVSSTALANRVCNLDTRAFIASVRRRPGCAPGSRVPVDRCRASPRWPSTCRRARQFRHRSTAAVKASRAPDARLRASKSSMESAIPLIAMHLCLENEAAAPCNSTPKDAGRQPVLRYAVLLRREIAGFARSRCCWARAAKPSSSPNVGRAVDAVRRRPGARADRSTRASTLEARPST
jgi:hypothetical protein